MATFEERELVDYTMKKIAEATKHDAYVIKDLDKMHNRMRRMEEKLRRIIEKIENLENRTRSLERENIFEKQSESESESD